MGATNVHVRVSMWPLLVRSYVCCKLVMALDGFRCPYKMLRDTSVLEGKILFSFVSVVLLL